MNEARRSELEDIERLVEEEVGRRLDAMVHDAVGKEEDIRFRQLKWFMVFIGLVGLGTFGTLTNYLIEKAVDSKIESSTGRISNTLEMFRMQNAAIRIELDEGLTQERTEEILSFLRRAEDLEDIRDTKEFKSFLLQCAEALIKVDRTSAVDEIFTAYEDEIISSPAMVEMMLHHYGQQLAVMKPTGASQTEVAFNKLSRFAEDSNVPEVALLYRTLHEVRNSKKETRGNVTDLIEESRDLDATDRRLYFEAILRFTRHTNWINGNPTPQSKALERVSRQFMASYGPDISSIYGVRDAEDAFAQLATEGMDTSDGKVVATIIASALDSRSPDLQSGPEAP